VALVVFLASVVKLTEALFAWRLVRPLTAGECDLSDPPTLSVVIPARNEKQRLEEALRTVLGQEYPGILEVVLVDDRSGDGTGETMERLAAGNDSVVVVRVEELPEGWLGKNHAIHAGTRRARGEWLLFTDADVRFAPDAFRRAVAHAEARGLDHLTMRPGLVLPGYWLESFVAFFYAAFLVHRGYYKANLPSSRTGVGIGAFNLIRRHAYEKVGGYEAFSNRPDDDLTLGNRVKGVGLRQELALGHGLLEVEWYSSLAELLQGVEKNTFAALGYSVPKTAGYVLALPLLMAGPFIAIPFSSGASRVFYLGAAAAQIATFAVCNRFLGRRVFSLAIAYPVCALLFPYVLARSALLALARGGIYWRGTFYSLSLLERGEKKIERE
jgi:glycosyltransferase involved in cell wall biosynthesis